MPYSLEYYVEKKPTKLSEDNHNYLVDFISSKWDEWDNARSASLDAISAVEKAIYPSFKPQNPKINISMPEVYEIRETYKAHLWKSWFSSLDSMFDVQGKNKSDQAHASMQKASLIDVFRSIDLVSKLERGLDNWINKGEFIAFISWSTKIRQVRRKNYLGKTNENYSSQFSVKDEVVYDGPDIAIVPSEAFVFNPAQKENFETAQKVYRSWASFDEIKANKLYKNIEGLEEICTQKKNRNSVSRSENRAFKDDKLEILEFWGDVKLSDGTLLKNQVITLAGRQNIIRFEENPFIINPFVYAAFLEDPQTKRGYSPLYVALPMNEASEIILNLQLDALRLIINKPYLAPKGALSGKINIKEGAIIEYDPSLMPKEPVPLDFKDALVGWDFLRFFESKIESATGIFKYMTGEPSGMNHRTATEASGIMTGQNIRISKEIDVLNFRVKIPIIKKIADLLANFSFDVREIKVALQSGDTDFAMIDEAVRQGSYEYLIGDSNAAFERKTKLKESLEFLYQAAKHPEVAPRIKWVEVMKWAFAQIGSVDPNMFIKD